MVAEQMAEARRTEVAASHNFKMRQQFLEDELTFDAQDPEATEHSLDEAQGQLTTDTVDLKMTEDVLAGDCQAKAVEFETATNGRSEELDAYAKARAVISQKTSGAEFFSYGPTQTSFPQLSRSMLSSRRGLAKFGAVRETRELAKSEHSLELAQLASRVASAMHAETFTGDVNVHAQHVVNTVEVEKPKIIELTEIIKMTVQRKKSIIQEKINQVTKHVEVSKMQFMDKAIDIPVVAQRQVSQLHVVPETAETPQFQVADQVVDVPVVLVVQGPLVHVVAKTVQIPQLLFREKTIQDVNADLEQVACETCVKDNTAMVAREGTSSTSGSKHQQRTSGQAGKEEGEKKKIEGRKEERKVEERGEQVEEDVTGWTEVTRNKRKKVVQIFVKVDGMKMVAMEVSPEDKVQKILNTVSGIERDVYVTSGGRILRGSDKLKNFEVRDGSTVEVTSRMRGGGGKHREKKSKIEKEWSGSPKKIEQAHGQKVEVQPSRNVDEMYVMMEEQMRLMREEAKGLHVTGEVMRRIVEHVVKMRLMAENMKKQASDDDLKCVEKMERGLKVFMEEVRDRQKELEMRETKEEQNVKMSPGRKATREGRGCAGLVQGGDEMHRMNETCGKGKGKGNGGKGEHGGKGDKGGKGHEGTRKLRWADCEEEEEGARQGAAEGEWHKARKEQGIIWLDGSYEDQEDHEGSAGGERCEVCGRLEGWSEESEEQEGRGGQRGEGVRQKMPSEEDEEDERTVVAPNTGAGGSHPRATTDPEEEVKEEEVTGEEMADEKPPGLEVVKSKQEEQGEEEWSQVKSEREVQEEEEQEEVKSEQEVREDEERRKQEAREARAQEAREEEKRALEAREEEKRAQEAREEEKRAQEAREEEKRAQEAQEQKRAQEAREEQRRAQEAREEQRRAQEAREEQRRAQEAPELRRSEREVSAREERTEQEREVEAQEGHESEGKAQEGHEGEVKAQGGQQENANSVHEECHVSNRHMTWWHNAWWIRVDNGPHMRSARGRRRVWRAARRAAEQARDEDGAGEVQRLAEEAEREKWGRKQTDRQTRQGSENTLHIEQQPQPQQCGRSSSKHCNTSLSKRPQVSSSCKRLSS